MGGKKMIVCTDDISVQNVEKYWSYWEKLKKKFPGLKLNAFVVPRYRDDYRESISRAGFNAWYHPVSNWVKLHLHGYTHLFPPEYLLSYERQKDLIETGAVMLGKVTRGTFGIKAPGYKFNDDTIRIAKELCFDFFAKEKSVLFLKENKEIQYPEGEILNTHTNGKTADSIEKIYPEVEKLLQGKTFQFIEELL